MIPDALRARWVALRPRAYPASETCRYPGAHGQRQIQANAT